MQRDLKIGLLLGLALVVVATLRLATHPRLSPKARITRLHNNGSGAEPNEQPIPPVVAENQPPDATAVRNDSAPAPSQVTGPGAAPVEPTDAIETEQNVTYDWTIHEQTEKIRPQRFHIITKGQTLSEIAYKYYGSARQWPKILEANRKVIQDPKKLMPGTKIIIPD